MWVEVRDISELHSGSMVELSRVGIPNTTLDLGLEVKAFREAKNRCSSLGCRVRVDLIGRDYE